MFGVKCCLESHQSLPTRLSTKLSFRSACLTSGGGQPVRVVAVLEVRLGFSRSERDTAGRLSGLHKSCVQDAFAPSESWEHFEILFKVVAEESCWNPEKWEGASEHAEAVAVVFKEEAYGILWFA